MRQLLPPLAVLVLLTTACHDYEADVPPAEPADASKAEADHTEPEQASKSAVESPGPTAGTAQHQRTRAVDRRGPSQVEPSKAGGRQPEQSTASSPKPIAKTLQHSAEAAPPAPSVNFTESLLQHVKEVVSSNFAGSKMPGYGEPPDAPFGSLPSVDIASFGLTCNINDLKGRWKWDNKNAWLAGSAFDDDAWIDFVPDKMAFWVNVKADPMEEVYKLPGIQRGTTALDTPANRTQERGPVLIAIGANSATQVDRCAWRLSFQEPVENRSGTTLVNGTCTMAVEYAAMGARTLTDKDDFLWERLNFFDCFPAAEFIRGRVNELGLRMGQDHSPTMFDQQHWLQYWSRKRQTSWKIE